MEQIRKRKRKKKKRSKKWPYILLVFVLIILGVGGYVLYEFKFKEYDVADPEIDEIVEDTYVLQLPDGTEVVVDKEGNIVEQKAAGSNSDATTAEDSQTNNKGTNADNQQAQTNQVTNESETQESLTTNENSNTSTSTENSEPTVASIKEKYMPTLSALEAQAASKIDGLISRAVSEYSAKKANGEEISVGYFYSKYAGAAQGLEVSTDAAFNSLMGIIEQDLEANGFDKSHAQSFRDQYEAAKKARQDAILSKVQGFL